MKLDNEMLLLTLNRLQYISKTISDSARLQEMLHLIDVGGFVLYPKNAIQPKTASTLEDLTDGQLADLRNKMSPALNLAQMILAGSKVHIKTLQKKEAQKVIDVVKEITKTE